MKKLWYLNLKTFFFPCLLCLSDGNIYTQELLRTYVIDYFKLTPEEANTLIKSGKKTQVSDKVSWTVSYFLQAGLIDAPKRGTYKINDFGKNFYQSIRKDSIKRTYYKSNLLQILQHVKMINR